MENRKKIVVLDGYTLCAGELNFDALREFGEVTVYDRVAQEDVAARIGDAQIVLTTETAAPELTPSPTPASTPIPTDSGDSGFDFSQVDNPLATPVAVNPIDMPTPTPTPAPNYAYETYKNDSMGISFDIPYTWLLNPATNQETTIQFVEPKSDEPAITLQLTAKEDPLQAAERFVKTYQGE